MTNGMPWLPSTQCACGQPWEAHELRCPRPKHRGVGRVIALAVAGGVVLQVVFVVALVFAAGLTSPGPRFSPAVFRVAPAGPMQPRVRACEEFYAWQGLTTRSCSTRRSPTRTARAFHGKSRPASGLT
jgi:hypothetical protein